MSEQNLKLNLEDLSFVLKSENIQPSEPFSQPSQPYNCFSLNAKTYIPKSKIKDMSETPLQSEKKFNFDCNYIMSFKNLEICQEIKLLSDEIRKHLEDYKLVESVSFKQKNQNNKDNKRKEVKKLSIFGPRDYSEEFSLSEQIKKDIYKEVKTDSVKLKITEFLNILTVDNYNEISEKIYEIIEKEIGNQEKFLDILFNKIVSEKVSVGLYAKLCKDFNKKLPQKSRLMEDKKSDKPKKYSSIMRMNLIDKCREIFRIENNDKFDEYIKVQNPQERNIKFKNFILGSINFIVELIKIGIISKKIVKQCLDILFSRFYDINSDEFFKIVNLEAIVIILNNFGTLLKKKEKKIKEDDKKLFNNMVDEYLQKLEYIINNNETPIEQSIKNKIIDLIDKSKNNWEESKLVNSIEVKEINNLEEELVNIGKGKTTKILYTKKKIIEEISSDLMNFKYHILEEEGNPSDFDWKIIESIYNEHGNSVADIIEGYIYSCVNFVQDDDKNSQ